MTRVGRRLVQDEHGITPVIGTLLILFIVIVAIAGILLWGVPAIQGLQERAEFQSALGQFVELNADLSNLRDPQSTALDRISINRGTISLVQGGRWVFIETDTAGYKTMSLDNWDDDTPANIKVDGQPGTPTVTLDRVDLGSFTQTDSKACASGCTLSLGTYPAGKGFTDYAWRVRAKEATVLKAEAWVINTKRLSYELSTESELNRLYLEMGAVMSRQGSAIFIEEPPLVKEPDFTTNPKDTLFFVRALEIQGTTSASGKGRFPVLVNLVDNYGPSQGRPTMSNVLAVRIQIHDPGNLLEVGFCNYLDARTYWVEAGTCDDGDVNLQYDPGAANLFTHEMSHSVVSTIVRSI